MKFKLYPFQVEGRDFLLSKKRLCLFDELGTGKSVQVLAAIEKANFKKVLLIAPAGLLLMWEQMIRDVLGEQYLRRFTLVSYNYIQLPRKKKRETEKAKVRRLNNNKKLNGLLKVDWDLVVADEMQKCVYKDSLVATPAGQKPISSIKAGDLVYSSSTYGYVTNKVVEVSFGWGEDLLEYVFFLDTGLLLRCLAEHKIRLSNGEWKKAKDIKAGSYLRGVSEEICSAVQLERKQILFKKLFCYLEMQTAAFGEFWSKRTSRIQENYRLLVQRSFESSRIKEDEKEQSDEGSCSKSKSTRYLNKNKAQTPCSRRKWETFSKSAVKNEKALEASFQDRGYSRVSCFIKGLWKKISFSLQNRLCFATSKTSCGSRRKFSQPFSKKETGQEKNKSFRKVRVDRIEVQKLRGSGFPREGLADFRDLSLEKAPYNYIANGVVVHNCKNWTSQTTRGWRHLVKDYSGYLWMLTGTPATRTGSDYYVYLKTLQPEKWGTYSEFTKEMCECIYDHWSGGFKYAGLKQSHRKVIKEAFFPHKLRRLKKYVLDQLPRKIHKEIPVKINAKIVKECLDAKSKYNLNGDKIDPHVAVILRSIGLGKVMATLEFISTCDEPLVIFAVHTEVIEKIRDGIKRLGYSVATVTGKDSAKAKNKAVTDFQSGKIDHIICNVQAGGTGITLTRSKHCIIAEQCWNPADMVQAMGRIDRISQKSKCIQFTLLTGVGTLDTHIKKVREEKYEFMKEVMGDE